MRSGRKSSRSKTTGPAAIAPAVASRSALTASASSPGGVGRLGLARVELARQLEHAEPVDVAPELRRHQSARLRPQLTRPRPVTAARTRMPPPSSTVAPAESPTSGAIAAYERAVPKSERSISAYARVERIVVPVEPAAALGDRGEHRQQNRPEERVVLRRADSRVRVREDRRGRLAAQVVDRVPRVGQPAQRRRLFLDEAAHERPVLVERRPAARRVLLERERQLRPALDRERRRGRTRAGDW